MTVMASHDIPWHPMASHGMPWHPMAQVLYNEVAYFTPYGADHVGVFDLKTERFGAMAGTM